MPEPLPAAFRITVPTNLVFVRPVRKMLEAVLSSQGWGEEDVDDAALVITEIVQNAIEHGSKCDGSEWVEVGCTVNGAAVELEVVDPGSGKDPREAIERDVKKPVPLDATRGRGLFLIDRLCGEFDRTIAQAGGLRVWVRRECDS